MLLYENCYTHMPVIFKNCYMDSGFRGSDHRCLPMAEIISVFLSHPLQSHVVGDVIRKQTEHAFKSFFLYFFQTGQHLSLDVNPTCFPVSVIIDDGYMYQKDIGSKNIKCISKV